ncbi:MAG: ATP synthase F1 subunit gamma [Thermoanaerobaculia bacterium]|nr:ATP synthase F1 subunit gamma [Thermoanaerobaculia bacterium]
MPNLIDIRRRIRSVKNTQQITRAMKMVAAAKLRRAQDRILSTRPYALSIKKVIGNLVARSEELPHPLLDSSREEETILFVVVTGDKGLAGSFNANVLRRADERLEEWPEVELMLLGKKGADYYRKKDVAVRTEHKTLFSGVEYSDAEAIAREIGDSFADEEYDAVYVVFNQFKSVMTQVLTEERLLPIEASELPEEHAREYEFEPSPEEILEELLPRYLTFQVYRILLESQAAEHAARMTAMDSATKNASEMIDDLTLQYNRARQAAITTELIEVVSGANALEE